MTYENNRHSHKGIIRARPRSVTIDLSTARAETNHMNVSRETYTPGQFIFLEGDNDLHFYIVEEGKVEIFTEASGKYLKIAEVGPGESFGEFAMLIRAPRTASARALTEAQVVKVTEQGFEELLGQIPDWASSMLRSFAQRLRDMNTRLKEIPQFVAKK
jgi:CRP/FNR family transcriptional regulator, cyclic AMP receptor protein